MYEQYKGERLKAIETIRLSISYTWVNRRVKLLIVYNRAHLEVSCSHLFYLRLWTEKTANSFISQIKPSHRMNNAFGREEYSV